MLKNYTYTPHKETTVILNCITINESDVPKHICLLQSCNVYQAAYDCEWYDTSPSFKTSIQIIMRQAQKARTLTAANFCSVSLETFTAVSVHDPNYNNHLYLWPQETNNTRSISILGWYTCC
jgi:hypothetical protein